MPDIDDDTSWDVDGGVMFGFEAKYNNLSFAYLNVSISID